MATPAISGGLLPDGTYECRLGANEEFAGSMVIAGDTYVGPDIGEHPSERFLFTETGDDIEWLGPLGGFSAAGYVPFSTRRLEGGDGYVAFRLLIKKDEVESMHLIDCEMRR